MSNFKLTDKYGNVFDARNGNPGWIVVHFDDGWWAIPDDAVDNPTRYHKKSDPLAIRNFKFTDKHGKIWDAYDSGFGSLHILCPGGWRIISKTDVDDLTKAFNAVYRLSHKSGLNLKRLSTGCNGYDYMWKDKTGWHVTYPKASGHKDCKTSGARASFPIVDSDGFVIAWASDDCKCPCHHNWDPNFATSFNDKTAKDDVSDADLINTML